VHDVAVQNVKAAIYESSIKREK